MRNAVTRRPLDKQEIFKHRNYSSNKGGYYEFLTTLLKSRDEVITSSNINFITVDVRLGRKNKCYA